MCEVDIAQKNREKRMKKERKKKEANTRHIPDNEGW